MLSFIPLLSFSLVAVASRNSVDLSLAERAALPADAPFTQSTSTYQSAIVCPNGIQNKPGGVVLLVPRAGADGKDIYEKGPYVKLLPTTGPGYDVCWLNPPSKNFADIQLSAEYVAYAISYLAAQSPGSGHKINYIGYSVGAGILPQWTLTFFPSVRKYIINYISIGPEDKGEETLAGSCVKILGFLVPWCKPAIYQYKSGSRVLNALSSTRDKNSGAQALVPTTTIVASTDILEGPEGVLPGSTLANVLADEVCGSTHTADHNSLLGTQTQTYQGIQFYDSAVYGVALQTLKAGKSIDPASIDKRFCLGYLDGKGNISPSQAFDSLGSLVDSITSLPGNLIQFANMADEPMLQPYACQRGYASALDCGKAGFKNNYE